MQFLNGSLKSMHAPEYHLSFPQFPHQVGGGINVMVILIQSTLALWTPCYYRHSLLWTKFRSPSLTLNEFRYNALSVLRTQNDVPKVSAITRVDCNCKIILKYFGEYIHNLNMYDVSLLGLSTLSQIKISKQCFCCENIKCSLSTLSFLNF